MSVLSLAFLARQLLALPLVTYSQESVLSPEQSQWTNAWLVVDHENEATGNPYESCSDLLAHGKPSYKLFPDGNTCIKKVPREAKGKTKNPFLHFLPLHPMHPGRHLRRPLA